MAIDLINIKERESEDDTQFVHAERQDIQINNQRIVVNVSGLRFETYIKTLETFPNTLLGSSNTRMKFYDEEKNELFFNRSRSCFEHILYYYQSGGTIRYPPNIPIEIFIEEIEFFCLNPELISQIRKENLSKPKEKDVLPEKLLRKRLWLIIEYPESSLGARIFAAWSICVIMVSITMFCIETLPQYSVTTITTNSNNVTTKNHYIKQEYEKSFFAIETACIVWFSFELVARFILSPQKCHFAKNLLNVIDLLSITPYFITLATKEFYNNEASSIEVIRVIRLVRVFRIFKLSRHSKGLQILGKTLKTSLREMVMLGFFLCVIVVLFSSAVYFAEFHLSDTQFNSIPDAFWWAVVTITTVGYGDIRPIGLWGKIVGALCAVAGVLTIALPVPVIVSNFNHFYQLETEKKKILRNDTEAGNEHKSHISAKSKVSPSNESKI
ncbi:potassium voltage-gated channel subfamily A member 10-like [Octopus sinensis]|uniref:Potassium voltage-gated channel subfamily A member 10-like n=1 Tax=Octopus sinensis TaxID=2607531 RepID=A0A6P7U2Q8_9MOLL|nr:potassium voltage-gated channel subfamily A member 10-like [Octopus sinensis]